jgi:hypothetical protein
MDSDKPTSDTLVMVRMTLSLVSSTFSGDSDGVGVGTLEALLCTIKRKSTFKVWNDFDELFTMRNIKKARYVARCKYFGHGYSNKSFSGIGHLKRHTLACVNKNKLIAWLNLF